MNRFPSQIIIRPWITEKAMLAMEKNNQYWFEVARFANRTQVKAAVEKIYGVKVEKVNIINRKGKPRSMRYWQRGRTPQVKLAIVRLKPGFKIDIVG